MTIADLRCILFHTPNGKRLRLLPAPQVLAMVKAGTAKQIGQRLWQAEPDAVEPPLAEDEETTAPPPKPKHQQQPQKNHQQPQGQGRNKNNRHNQGSRAK